MTTIHPWVLGLGPKPDHLFEVPAAMVHEKVYPVHRYGPQQRMNEAQQAQLRMDIEAWTASLGNYAALNFAIFFALRGPYVNDEFRSWVRLYWVDEGDEWYAVATAIWKQSKMEIEAATECAIGCYNNHRVGILNCAFNAAWYRRFDSDVYAIYEAFFAWDRAPVLTPLV